MSQSPRFYQFIFRVVTTGNTPNFFSFSKVYKVVAHRILDVSGGQAIG